MTIVDRFFQWIGDTRHAQHICVISLSKQTVVIETATYSPRTQILRGSGVLKIVNGINETGAFRWKVKMILRVLLFPFRYTVLVALPKEVSYSVYFTVPVRRQFQKETVSEEELRSIFANYLGKFLDLNKKQAQARMNIHEAQIVLAHSHVVDVWAGKKYYHRRMNPLFAETPKALEVGMIQTFVSRDLFDAVVEALPKRASLAAVAQEGFHLALEIMRVDAANNGRKKSLSVAHVGRDRTHLYHFDGERLEWNDAFVFGYRSLYEALNNALLVGLETFFIILGRMQEQKLSARVHEKVGTILNKETTRFSNGMTTFKKRIKPGNIYINPGVLEPYLGTHSKTKKQCVRQEQYMGETDVNALETGLYHARNADLLAAMGLYHENAVSTIAKQSVRWLLPDVLAGKQRQSDDE